MALLSMKMEKEADEAFAEAEEELEDARAK